MDSKDHVENIRRKLENSASSKCSLNQVESDFLRETVMNSYKVWLLIKSYPQLRDEYHFLRRLENAIDSYHNGDSKLAYICEYCDSEIELLNNDPEFSYDMHRQSREHIELVSSFALLNNRRVAMNETLDDQSTGIQNESLNDIEGSSSVEAKESEILQRKISVFQAGTPSTLNNASEVMRDLTKDAVGRPLLTFFFAQPLSTWYFSEFETTSPDHAIDRTEVGKFFSLTSRICSLCNAAVPLGGDEVHVRGRRHRELVIRKLAEANKWVEVRNCYDLSYFTTSERSDRIWLDVQSSRKNYKTKIFVQFFVHGSTKHWKSND